MIRHSTMFIAFTLAWAIAASAQPPKNNASQAPPQASTAPEAGSKAANLPKGVRVLGELKTKVDSKRAKPGQAVVIEVTKDVKSGDQILLKKGSQIKGTITEVQAFSKGKSDAELGIVLDSVVPKGGDSFTDHFAIFALAAKVEKQPEDIYATKGTAGLANSAGVSGQTNAPSSLDLTPQTTGIFGFAGVELHPLSKMTPPTAVLNSKSGNIVLDDGTGLVLESVGQ